MNVFYLLLLFLALAVIDCLVGGTRLLFSLPAYGILALAALGSLAELRRAKIPPNGPCLASVALFFGWIIARALTSEVVYLARPDFFCALGALMVYLLTACCLTDPRRRLWVLWGLLAIAAANVLVGCRQFTSGGDFMLFGFLRSLDYRGRASGLYICPNHLAGFLEVVGPLAISAAFWSRSRPWVRLLFGYLGGCCYAGLVMSASRGGMLSASVGLAALVLLGLFRTRHKYPGSFPRIFLAVVVILVLVAIGASIAIQKSDFLMARIQAAFHQRDARLMLWPAAVAQYRESRVVGTGAGSYLYYGRKFRDPRVQAEPIWTHNDYLQLLAEYGLVGAAGGLLLLGTHLFWGAVVFRRMSLGADGFRDRGGGGSNAAALNIGALAALAGFAVHTALDFNLHIPANALLLAFVFGLLANPGRDLSERGQGQPAAPRGIDLAPKLVLAALGIWTLAAGVPLLPGEFYAEKARVALRDKKWLPALNFASEGLDREEKNPDLYFYLGEARQNLALDPTTKNLFAQSFLQGAVEPYEEGLKLFPQDVRLLMRLGQALIVLGNYPQAKEVLDRARRWDPNSARVLTYYGYLLQSKGLLNDAEAAYQRAQALESNQAVVSGLEQIQRARMGEGVKE